MGKHTLCRLLCRLCGDSAHHIEDAQLETSWLPFWVLRPPRAPVLIVNQVSEDFKASLPVPKPNFDSFRHCSSPNWLG